MMQRLTRALALLLSLEPLASGLRWGAGPNLAPYLEAPGQGAELALERLEAALARTWTERPEGGRARYVVWREGGPGAGWGNRFRGITSSLLLSLVTGRRFLIDHGDFFDVFSDPSNATTLDYRNLAASLRRLPEKLLPYTSPAYRRPISLSQVHAGLDERASGGGASEGQLLRQLLSSDVEVLVHQCGCSFELDVLASPSRAVRREVLSIFGSLREDALVEVAIRYLTRRPRQVLKANAGRVLAGWRRSAYDGFAMVQDRRWTDVRSQDRGGKEQVTDRPHLNCTYRRLLAYRSKLPGRKRLLIGITSDSAEYAGQMMQAFASLGDVRRNTLFNDNSISYASSSTPLVARQFVVDWFILREAPFVVCTGSTYCISARASGGLGNDGTFPYVSDRRTYRQGGAFCYGDSEDAGSQLSIDTLSHPGDGRVFW